MSPILVVAGKEMRDGIRHRWVIAATLLMAALALTLSLLGSTPTGTVRVSSLSVTVVSLSSLTIFLVPLIALLVSHDAIAGEIERGTMALMLSYPVRRWHIIAGKFMGHSSILLFATVIGYGSAGLALAVSAGPAEPGAVGAFIAMVGSSVLLGMVFVALGYLSSALARDARSAAGIAIGIWLLFALLYDMALLGLLIADQGRHVTAGILNGLFLLNPADVYRLLNLTGFGNISVLAGMAGVGQLLKFGNWTLLAALLAWTAVPLALATAAFARREL